MSISTSGITRKTTTGASNGAGNTKTGAYVDQLGKPTGQSGILAGKYYSPNTYETKSENFLVSFFGRANWSILERYYLTATVRDDGSSRFKEHWAVFPSLAFAWKLKDEKLFKDIKSLSD